MEYLGRSIPTAVKRAVLARDGMVCVWCGYAVVEGVGHAYRPDRIHFDHVIPFAAGGDHGVDNLVVSCARCNLSRPKPKENVRLLFATVEYRYNRYWWPEGYTPPRIIEPHRCGFLLKEYAAGSRDSLSSIVQQVHRGLLPATGQGEPIYIDPPDRPKPSDREKRLRRRRAMPL